MAYFDIYDHLLLSIVHKNIGNLCFIFVFFLLFSSSIIDPIIQQTNQTIVTLWRAPNPRLTTSVGLETKH